MRKYVLERIPRVWMESFHKSTAHRVSKPPQQKPRIEMELSKLGLRDRTE
jgi:hypothetical protein